MTKKALSIEFAPGCFDNFDGTQEELNELVAEIQRMFDSGELEENANLINFDELVEEDPEFAEAIFNSLNNNDTRTLQ